MNLDFYINFRELDGLQADEGVALTFAEAKFNNIVSRGGSFSNSIKFGKTANNLEVFGYPDESQGTSRKPYIRYEATIKYNGNPIFEGFAFLEESEEYYGVRFFTGSGDFFSTLGNKTLRELDLSSLNHTWDASTVRGNLNNATGFVYPAVNYGRFSGAKSTRLYTDFFPATYFKDILEKAAMEAGWTLEGYTSNWAIPFSLQNVRASESIAYKIQPTSNYTQNVGNLYVTPTGFDDVINDPLSRERDSLSSVPGGYQSLVPSLDASYDVRLYLKYTWNPTDASRVGVNVMVSQDIYSTTVGGLKRSQLVELTAGTNQEVEIFIEGVKPEEVGGLDYYIVFFEFVQIALDVSISVTVSSDSYFEIVRGEESGILAGTTLPISDNLPNLQCKDLFLFEAVRLNALIVTDQNAKTLRFVRFDDIAAKAPVAKDWTAKVDLRQKPKYQYRLDYAQLNSIRWADGTDDDPAYKADKDLGIGTIAVDDETLKPTADIYKAKFAASALQPSFDDEVHALIPRYSAPSVAFDEPDIDPKPRAMRMVTTSDADKIISITGQAATTSQKYGTPVTFQEIITDNYSAFVEMLNRTKTVEVFVYLNEIDIANLDFTTPVRLLRNVWFIREVEQWSPNQSTKVKLIRL